MDFFINSVMV